MLCLLIEQTNEAYNLFPLFQGQSMPNGTLLDPRGKADKGKSNQAIDDRATDSKTVLNRLGLAPDAKSIESLRRRVPGMFGPQGREVAEPRRPEDLPPGLRYAAGEELYARLLREGAEKLSRVAFGRPEFGRDPTVGGDPVFGVEDFDERYWSVEGDTRTRSKLVLLPKKSPAQAIDAIFDKRGEGWKCDCALFVQILHLYALRHTYGAVTFNQRQGPGMVLRIHGSTGIDRRMLYERIKPDQQMWRSDGKFDPRTIDQILRDVPLGTRVMWTNRQINPATPEGRALDAYRFENTVKVGREQFAALGFGMQRIFTRGDLELNLAKITKKSPTPAYIAENVFIKEVEEYRLPFDRAATERP
jgi:hypothetical protein